MDHLLTLNDEELLALDGKCRPNIQARVDQVRFRRTIETTVLNASALTNKQRESLADLLVRVERTGKVDVTGDEMSTCAGCEAQSRHPRYVRGPKAGQPNFNKPMTKLYGFRVLGTSYCRSCFKTIQPVLVEVLATVKVEVSARLTGEPPRFYKFDNRVCRKCGWEGHEGQMGIRNALMGGQYRAGCPQCSAENIAFGPHYIETRPGFVVLPAEECPEETRRRKTLSY